MYKKAHPMFLICQTPLHVGSGSELGVIDLPIQREKHTGFPKIEGSSLKGALREAIERAVNSKSFKNLNDDDVKIHRIFGYDDGSLRDGEKEKLKNIFKKTGEKDKYETDFSGCAGFTDARLLLFPVKSMKGVFAWVTCLKALKQFQQDMKIVNKDFVIQGLGEDFIRPDETYVFSQNNTLKIGGDNIVLEEYAFMVSNELNGAVKVRTSAQGDAVNFPDWLAANLFNNDKSYWSGKLKNDIVVLPDNDFADFVNLSTEVITRTKIDNATGTVATGALFSEEYLPAESVMYSLVLAADEFTTRTKDEGKKTDSEVINFIEHQLSKTEGIIQIGGNATIGKGIVFTKLLNNNNNG